MQRLKYLVQPTEDWGPALKKYKDVYKYRITKPNELLEEMKPIPDRSFTEKNALPYITWRTSVGHPEAVVASQMGNSVVNTVVTSVEKTMQTYIVTSKMYVCKLWQFFPCECCLRDIDTLNIVSMFNVVMSLCIISRCINSQYETLCVKQLCVCGEMFLSVFSNWWQIAKLWYGFH